MLQAHGNVYRVYLLYQLVGWLVFFQQYDSYLVVASKMGKDEADVRRWLWVIAKVRYPASMRTLQF